MHIDFNYLHQHCTVCRDCRRCRHHDDCHFRLISQVCLHTLSQCTQHTCTHRYVYTHSLNVLNTPVHTGMSTHTLSQCTQHTCTVYTQVCLHTLSQGTQHTCTVYTQVCLHTLSQCTQHTCIHRYVYTHSLNVLSIIMYLVDTTDHRYVVRRAMTSIFSGGESRNVFDPTFSCMNLVC